MVVMAYRLDKVLGELDTMAHTTLTPSSVSPVPSINNDYENDTVQMSAGKKVVLLPKSLRKVGLDAQRERENIQSQPFRTTQLVFPNPKSKPDLVTSQLIGDRVRASTWLPPAAYEYSPKPGNYPAFYRQEPRNIMTGPPQRFNSQPVEEHPPPAIHREKRPTPRPQDFRFGAIGQSQSQRQQQPSQVLYVETEPRESDVTNLSLLHPMQKVIYRPQNSPTCRAIWEEEVIARPAPRERPSSQNPAPIKKMAHATAPSHTLLNTVGMPMDRIPQSDSFNRVMWKVLGSNRVALLPQTLSSEGTEL